MEKLFGSLGATYNQRDTSHFHSLLRIIFVPHNWWKPRWNGLYQEADKRVLLTFTGVGRKEIYVFEHTASLRTLLL